MNKSIKGATKRLILSLLALSALGGCAVYAPPPAPYAYSTDAYGQPVYGAQPMYAAPPVYAPPPVYIGPPLFLNFGLGFWGGHHGGGRSFGGGRGGGHH